MFFRFVINNIHCALDELLWPIDSVNLFSVSHQGACILHMLRHFLTDDVFQSGTVRYLRKYSYRNAKNQDLWNSLANVGYKHKLLS